MRTLDDGFMEDLQKGGTLYNIIALLQQDVTLDFHIRDNQVHIYYRGGKIWDLKKLDTDRYAAFFDRQYCKGWTTWAIELRDETDLDIENKRLVLPPTISSEADVNRWIDGIPFLKHTMDEYFSKHPKIEREYQQHVVYENNTIQTAKGTDYFIVDVEYANEGSGGRFDLLALLWPSKASLRKIPRTFKPQMAFIEMKFGDGALSGNSGIAKHLRDIDTFLSDSENFTAIRKEMQSIFQQKRELGLLRSLTENSHTITEISDAPPQFILLLAAHDPESKVLFNELQELTPPEHCELKIAVANFMGYGLYQEAMYDLDEFRNCFSKHIYFQRRDGEYTD